MAELEQQNEHLKTELSEVTALMHQYAADAMDFLARAELAEAERDRLDAELADTRRLLRDLYAYTCEIEGSLAPWVATRPYMVQFPDTAEDLRRRLREVLGEDAR